MKKFQIITGVALALMVGLWPSAMSAATFNPNIIMDDEVFTATGSMNAAQINTFLNGFQYSCISPNSGFQARMPSGYSPNTGYTYGAYVTAGEVIFASSQVYGINPQVLLTTLEKEQSLVSGRSSPSYCLPSNDNNHKYAAAVGYGCPDSGSRYNYTGLDLYRRNGVTQSAVGPTCVNSATKAGFSQQVIRAAWLFKFGQERSTGNTGWNIQRSNYPQAGSVWDNSDDPLTCYGGPMTQGSFKRCSSDAKPVYYDGTYTIDGSSIAIQSGATAALYWYTPHFSGNQNFFNLFTQWFGGTIGASYFACKNGVNYADKPRGENIVPLAGYGKSQKLVLSIMNNTGSKCTEFHTWSNNLQSFTEQIASNLPAVNPENAEIISANTSGGADLLYLVQYRSTSSGQIEIHGWDTSKQHWASHIATNMPAVDPANYRVIVADGNGDGRDEFYLIKYRGSSSGKIEVHGWNPGLQSWFAHIATNMPAVDPANYTIIGVDSEGNGREKLNLVKYSSTGSGKIEVHVWNANLQSWFAHIATNMPAVDPANYRVIVADGNGDGRDEFYLIKYRGSSSGKIEVHGWNPGLQSWFAHIATSQNQLP